MTAEAAKVAVIAWSGMPICAPHSGITTVRFARTSPSTTMPAPSRIVETRSARRRGGRLGIDEGGGVPGGPGSFGGAAGSVSNAGAGRVKARTNPRAITTVRAWSTKEPVMPQAAIARDPMAGPMSWPRRNMPPSIDIPRARHVSGMDSAT